MEITTSTVRKFYVDRTGGNEIVVNRADCSHAGSHMVILCSTIQDVPNDKGELEKLLFIGARLRLDVGMAHNMRDFLTAFIDFHTKPAGAKN